MYVRQPPKQKCTRPLMWIPCAMPLPCLFLQSRTRNQACDASCTPPWSTCVWTPPKWTPKNQHLSPMMLLSRHFVPCVYRVLIRSSRHVAFSHVTRQWRACSLVGLIPQWSVACRHVPWSPHFFIFRARSTRQGRYTHKKRIESKQRKRAQEEKNTFL